MLLCLGFNLALLLRAWSRLNSSLYILAFAPEYDALSGLLTRRPRYSVLEVLSSGVMKPKDILNI